jgi:[ribosomal protein S5]-alanine N-acetyltransferase
MVTGRLGFSEWSCHDLPLACALWGDPRVTALMGGPFSDEQVLSRLAWEIESASANGFQYWPIFQLPDGEHVGCAGLRPYRPDEGVLELGFHLRPAFWGQGLAAEAGRAVIDFAFCSLDAQALFAGHHPENAASRRVLLKLGFRYSHDEYYEATGLLHPSYLLDAPC